MSEPEGSQQLSMGYRIKKSIVGISLLALSTAFEIVSKRDPELKAELKDWEEGRIFSMGVLPYGPSVTLQKVGDEIHYMGKGIKNPKLTIFFKNVDNALLPLSGQMGADTAFVQHRAILHGSVADAMQINRAMAMVQNYLMPGIVLKMNNKRPPKFTGAQLKLKAFVMGTLVIGLIKNAWKKV